MNGNIEVVKDFITYQAGLFTDEFAGHSGFPGFHFVILLLGLFPASVIMFSGIIKKQEDDPLANTFRIWMYILLAIVLVVFSLVQTKLVHYSSLAWYPITFLAAWVLHHWLGRKVEIHRWQLWILGFIGTLYVLVTLLIPVVMRQPDRFMDRYPQWIAPYVEGVLMTDAGWGILDFLPPLILSAGLIYAIPRIRKRDTVGMIVLPFITWLFTYTLMLLYVPKVERMVQGPAIDFIKEHSGVEHRVAALGFKSYAPYFYGKWMPGEMPQEKEKWIAGEPNGYPLYVVMKADNSERVLEKYPRLIVLEEKGGFIFALLMPTLD